MNTRPQRYDPRKSYQWNYDHAPLLAAMEREDSPIPGDWMFCGRQVDSPLGISAGPLLNGKWCLHYAQLGFDVLTYKTVRSRQHACYVPPNLQAVDCAPLHGGESHVDTSEKMVGSWAVSFGMPSADPDVWRRDILWTREQLADKKILCVSVVGTMQDGWGIDELADDYATCARWAVDSGADCIETNFSCPNVTTDDGQLFQNPEQSRQVCEAVRAAIPDTPYIIKIGHIAKDDDAERLLREVSDHADALAMTNSIAAKVQHDGEWMFDGQQRGICGSATRDASITQVKRFASAIKRLNLSTEIIGVGGIQNASDVRDYLDAGATACHLATAAMIDPAIGQLIRLELQG